MKRLKKSKLILATENGQIIEISDDDLSYVSGSNSSAAHLSDENFHDDD